MSFQPTQYNNSGSANDGSGAFSPTVHNVGLLFTLQQDSFVPPQPETNVHTLGKYTPVLHTLLPLLRQGILSADTVAETQPHVLFLGRHVPVVYARLRQHTQVTLTGEVAIETNVSFLGRHSPNLHTILRARSQDTLSSDINAPPPFVPYPGPFPDIQSYALAATPAWPVAQPGGGAKYFHQNAIGTFQVKLGAGTLYGLSINTGASSAIVTLTDAVLGSAGNTIGVYAASAQDDMLIPSVGLAFTNGLVVSMTGGAADITVMYA